MAFVQRVVNFMFALGEGAFGEGGTNTVTLSGLRASARISKAGGLSQPTAEIRIYGMTLQMMRELATQGYRPTMIRKNTVTVLAGTSDLVATAFIGQINNAWMDGNSSPDVSFTVQASTGNIDQVKPIAPFSSSGPVSAATVMAGLAAQMGFRFLNNGVTTQLPASYFQGSPIIQARQVVDAAGIQWNGGDNGILAIWPAGGAMGGSSVVISPTSGLIGYPAFTSTGIVLRSLFDPNVTMGSPFSLQGSSLQNANGDWVVYGVDYSLDTQVPNGSWFSDIQAALPGNAPVAS